MKNLIITIAALTLVAGFALADGPVVKKFEPVHYVYMETTGSYEKLPAFIEKFADEFTKQGLTPKGNLMGIYLNSPMQVAEKDLRWQIGFPVDESTKVSEPLQTGKLEWKEAVFYLYKGPYDKVAAVYGKIFTFLFSKGYKPLGPALEYYLNNPENVEPEDLKTEIYIPVIK